MLQRRKTQRWPFQVDLFGDAQAEHLRIEVEALSRSSTKSRTGPMLDDLERPRQQHAADIVFERQLLDVAAAGFEIHAFGLEHLDLLVLADLRQLGLLVEAALAHRRRLRLQFQPICSMP